MSPGAPLDHLAKSGRFLRSARTLLAAALAASRDAVAMLRLMLAVLADRLPDVAAAGADLATEVDALASAT